MAGSNMSFVPLGSTLCICTCTYVNRDYYYFLALRRLSVMNVVAAQEHEMWVTLGFLRGVSSPEGSGRAFCSPQWIELMMDIIRKASPLSPHSAQTKTLVQQVSSSVVY